MSFVFIYKFQNKLYTLLANDETIAQLVNKIYIGAVQDGKAPFLLVDINEVENLSRSDNAIYQVKFQISAYAKDTNHKLLTRLADEVLRTLSGAGRALDGYSISGMQANNIEFDKAQDLVLNKLVINCKALIKQEVFV